VIYDQDYNKRYKIIKANNIEELKDFKIKWSKNIFYSYNITLI
jgi:hypothetical protein